jgi:hypothetical protein
MFSENCFYRALLQRGQWDRWADDGEFLLLAAFEVAASSGEFADKELLRQACANPFGGANRKISEDQPDATIGFGVVKVREG